MLLLSLSGRDVKSGSFFKILPSATIVSVRYLTPKAIGIFKVFLDISYANLLHPWLKLAQTATVFYLYLHLEWTNLILNHNYVLQLSNYFISMRLEMNSRPVFLLPFLKFCQLFNLCIKVDIKFVVLMTSLYIQNITS